MEANHQRLKSCALGLLVVLCCVQGGVSALVGTFSTQENGELGTLEYRVTTLGADGNAISPWHDIPLFSKDGNLNFFCEIPANTTAKFETQTKEPGNPIAQDEKNGKPREYPYPILWNYGMIPRTWEDPDEISTELGMDLGGDNDPTDVVEIGSSPCKTGGVYEVKPICAFAMIDDGEVDWKVVVIPADNPKSSKISNAEDAEKEFPGELQSIYEWFRDYKIPSGDPPSEFGYNGTCVGGDILKQVLNTTHAFYNNLVSGARENTEELALPEIKSNAVVSPPPNPVEASGAFGYSFVTLALAATLATCIF